MSTSKLVLSTIFGAAAALVLVSPVMAVTQVNIQDSTIPARVAHVDPGNRLAVQEVPPSTFFHSSGFTSGACLVLATAPAGKALIIRQVRVDVFTDPNPGSGVAAIYGDTTCTTDIGAVNPPTIGNNTITFDPGYAVPEGSGISVITAAGVDADFYADGYTVVPSVAPLVGQVIQTHGKNPQLR